MAQVGNYLPALSTALKEGRDAAKRDPKAPEA